MNFVVISHDRRVADFRLDDKAELVLGRSSEADVAITEEPCLSRRHVVVRAKGAEVEVERVPTARNAVIYKGKPEDRFSLKPGECFVIGGTVFRLSGDDGDATPPATVASGETAPMVAHTMQPKELRSRGRSGDRMRLLDLMELPVVLRTKSRGDFFQYACGSLRLAAGAGWVQALTRNDDVVKVLAEDGDRDWGVEKKVSRRLIQSAIDEAPKPVTYCWGGGGAAGSIEATAHAGVQWAIACAMPIPGEAPVLFYVAGSSASASADIDDIASCDMSLRDTSRLVGLVAEIIGRTLAIEKLESWQTRLGRFFSGKIISKILESDAAEALAPRITEATVMFFDIRGFSLRTERNLNRIVEFTEERRRVLTAMTQCVFDRDGVVISYAGDGILACWNVPYAIENHAEQACLAALQMNERMAEVTDGWQCGIGLGLGDIVAGSLGSDQVYAFDILGAVVNQTSRIEGITKTVEVPMLVSEDVAKRVAGGELLTRKVARFVPAGMEEEISLFTVERTPEDAEAHRASQERLAIHAKGLEAFERGAWDEAFSILHPIVERDAAARYVYKMALQGKPPKNWRGVIELTAK